MIKRLLFKSHIPIMANYKLSVTMKKLLPLWGVLFTLTNGMAKEAPKVAITQIVSHPALNAVRAGIKHELETCAVKSILSETDAGGNITTASQIAQKLAEDNKVKLVIALSTPSAQSAVNAVRGKKTVLFSAISDPISAKIIGKSGVSKNVSGVSDEPPLDQQLDFIREVLPSLKTLGIVWNAGEDNARATIKSLEKLAKKRKIALKTVAVTKAADIPQAIRKLAQSVDAFYIPNDNMMASSIESVIKGAHGARKPVFAADILLVERGCLGMRGVDYHEIGRQTGRMACAILEGQPLKPFEKPEVLKTYLNKASADKLGITFPENMMENADKMFPIKEKID